MPNQPDKSVSCVFGLVVFACIQVVFPKADAIAQRQFEKLNRGIIAVPSRSDSTLVSWRLLATDLKNIQFHCYRQTDGGAAKRLTSKPISNATCYFDRTVDFAKLNSYYVRAVVNGVEQSPSQRF